ncbi:MAG: hypothetical protein HGA33_05140 [Candidatus Moranbacteria bacterium]|nr:hypothetical protein [Candidatus Moranbacteria bacterium]
MKLLYGIQPTGRIHIGNYLGGLRYAIEQGATVMVATYHAMTTQENPTFYPFADDVMKIGVTWSKVVEQSMDSLHLSWKIQCVTPISDLKRMTQFKEKGEGNVGLFTYPCLMAADIILSGADGVIVGEDQVQHMEFYRRTCKRLGIEKVAETILTDTPRIMSIKDPTRKMSKSAGDEHCLYLFDHEENRRKIMKAPTTPEGIENLRKIADGLGVIFDSDQLKETKERIADAIESI